MSDWRDFEEGRRGISVGQLADGESASFFVDNTPYLNQEEIQQEDGSVETSEALRVPVVPVDVPDGFTDMSGDPVETVGDPDDMPDEPDRYNIINSSTAFKVAMREAFPGEVSPVASVITITAEQEGDAFSRSYSIEP